MKVASIYIDKRYIAEKLGVKENQFVFGEIEGNGNGIEFRVYIDNDAEIKNAVKVSESDDNWNIPKQRLENTTSEVEKY